MHPDLLKGRARDRDYVIVDTETTGLSVVDRVVEVAAVRLASDGATTTFQSLVDPEGPVPEVSTSVHGLTDADLVDAPAIADVLPALTEFGRDAVWLAHNAGYDAGILGMSYMRCDLPAPEAPVLDTCRLARSCMPGQSSYRLEHLGRLLGLAESGYHRALADAEVTTGLFRACLERLGDGIPLRELARKAGGWLTIAGVAEAARHVPEGFEALAEAIAQGKTVRLQYNSGGQGRIRAVDVAPKVLYRGGDRHYLEAFCFDGRYVKSYRLDRVVAYEVRS